MKSEVSAQSNTVGRLVFLGGEMLKNIRQTTAIQAAGAVTMVTIAKAFPAWYVLGAAWMWMWVADSRCGRQ